MMTVFVATDEKNKTWFEPIREHYKMWFLGDFQEELKGVHKNYMGMVDQLVASKGRVFVGSYHSTFTGYINRMRGYRAVHEKLYGYQHGVIESYYSVPKSRASLKRVMKGYTAVQPAYWSREFPVCWRDNDHDVPEISNKPQQSWW